MSEYTFDPFSSIDQNIVEPSVSMAHVSASATVAQYKSRFRELTGFEPNATNVALIISDKQVLKYIHHNEVKIVAENFDGRKFRHWGVLILALSRRRDELYSLRLSNMQKEINAVADFAMSVFETAKLKDAHLTSYRNSVIGSTETSKSQMLVELGRDPGLVG